jgi:hypothetical protein
VAPAHANIRSVISSDGGVYHPCHGYSTRDLSIFDLFPGIVKYQSKKYSEADRVKFLQSLSDVAFVGVDNQPLRVDESEMWYMALKYLFNDVTLGQFDYMTVEMRYVVKQYLSGHRNRSTFLESISTYGFLRVISDVSKKLPRQYIRKLLHQERVKKQQQKLRLLHENEKLKAENARKVYQHQLMMAQQNMHNVQNVQNVHSVQMGAHAMNPYAAAYTMNGQFGGVRGGGAQLVRAQTEETEETEQERVGSCPVIVDEDEWDNVISEIVNEGEEGRRGTETVTQRVLDLDMGDIAHIPDLPAENEKSKSSKRPISLDLFGDSNGDRKKKAEMETAMESPRSPRDDADLMMMFETMNSFSNGDGDDDDEKKKKSSKENSKTNSKEDLVKSLTIETVDMDVTVAEMEQHNDEKKATKEKSEGSDK